MQRGSIAVAETPDPPSDLALQTPPPHSRSAERGVLWTLWLTYGAFYFCRTNLSVAVPGMTSAVDQGGLGLSTTEVGWILASMKIAYGLGQFFNGQLSERFPPRVMLALGMFGSAGLNVLFGFGTGFYFLLFVWATNGFCQSLGWTPCVRVAANWVPIERRGHAIGLIGTGYQVTFGLTYVIAGQASYYLGWRGALYVPAVLLASAGIVMLVFLREAPSDAERVTSDGKPRAKTAGLPFFECLYWTMYNPALWLFGITLGLLNAVRYGYFDWGLKHLIDTREMPVDKAVLQYFVIAIGATAGAYLAGWATDRFFGSRRAPVICILMASLGGLSLLYHWMVETSAIGTMIMLVVIGFCIIGPQVLLVGTAPADLAHRGASAAAAGFANFMGYMGAATGDVVTGYFSAPEHGGWDKAIYLWAVWAFLGAGIMILVWNATSRKVGILSPKVPKTGAILALATAAAATTFGGQPIVLQIALYASLLVLFAAVAVRWAALPAMIVATAGLLTVFLRYAYSDQPVEWHQTLAMLMCGLTMITTLMILVELKGQRCE